MFIERKIKKELRKANLNENEVKIIVRNLSDAKKNSKLPETKIDGIVHNILIDESYRARFLANPKGLIAEANPQPSPKDKIGEANPQPSPKDKIGEANPQPSPKDKISEANPQPSPKDKISEANPQPSP